MAFRARRKRNYPTLPAWLGTPLREFFEMIMMDVRIVINQPLANPGEESDNFRQSRTIFCSGG
jgi:hypothetical protein